MKEAVVNTIAQIAESEELTDAGGWLSAKEALDWGFVDEITDLADEPAPKLTDALASAMASEGMPIPNIPVANGDKESTFAKFIAALTAFFKPTSNPISSAMNKTYTFICAVLGISAIALTDNKASLSDEQLSSIEDALAEKDRLCNEQKQTIADLQAKLDKAPAEPTSQVVEDNKPGAKSEPKNDVEQFVDTYNSAKKLFAEV